MASDEAMAGTDELRRVPRVSLGMPLYNAERYLAQAFDSLLAQDFTDFELVVCDNASTDTTWAICEKYAAIDDRIRLYRNETNRGAAYNYNRVVDLARGELFKWVAYDDVCAPSLLRRCVKALDAGGPDVVLAYPRTMLIDDDGLEIGPYRDGLDLRSPRSARRVAGFARNWSLCNAVFGVIRTDVLRGTGMIRPYLSSDVVLLAELAARGRFCEVPERLFHRRIHRSSSRQGTASLEQAAQWFDTSRPASAKPVKVELTRRVASTLLRVDLPLLERIRCAGAFVVVWRARKAHMLASRWKRAVLRWPPAARHLPESNRPASGEAP